ncbi:MAG: hypothetical protein V3U26_07820 [Dehalococcoidia bacterium]
MWKYFSLLIALVVVAPLPVRLGYVVGRVAADISFLLAKGPRDRLSANVRRVLGPSADEDVVKHVTLGVFRNTAWNLYDMITIPRFDSDTIEHKLTIHGWDNFLQALDRGKGVVMASIHMGNMDVAVQVITARSVKLTILNQVLKPPQFYQVNTRLREHHGMSMLPVTYSGLKGAMRRLRKGEVVAIACDRAIQGSGLTIDFLGEETIIPVGAVQLAQRTGAAIVPAFAVRLERDRYAFYFEPPIFVSNGRERNSSIREPLTKIVRLMEQYIRRFPDQWMVFDPVWNLGPGSSTADKDGEGQGNGPGKRLPGKHPRETVGADEHMTTSSTGDAG